MQVNAVIMIIGVAIGLLFGGASMLFVWASAGVTLFGFLMFFVSMKNDIIDVINEKSSHQNHDEENGAQGTD
jgi:hypothetical protein